MQRKTTKSGTKAQQFNRIALVARVQLAYEQFTDACQRMRDGAPNARKAVAAARQRLQLLNRAMAMMALGGTQLTA